MPDMKINRDALVVTPDGELGRITHVIIAPETKEVTDLVVDNNDGETLVPIADVLSASGDRVILRRHRAQYETAGAFDRGAYHAVDDEEARASSQRRALHGGGPLLSAAGDTVEVGSAVRQPGDRSNPDPWRLQLIEERLHVATEPEQIGTVSIGTRIVEHLETLTVPTQEERVLLERLPGDVRVLIDGTELSEGESIELSVLKEQVEVAKELIVTEAVTVRKQVVEHIEQVQETLRKEELDVQEGGNLVVTRLNGC